MKQSELITMAKEYEDWLNGDLTLPAGDHDATARWVVEHKAAMELFAKPVETTK